ncbi:DUF4232 domain-containing protein [Amycolatopsis samaneae]|uniref:DUF4232 domain-containing protein n=1 Tax=Amycolatopsis samaneae TaxID=664691 RepID=A0ABW5GJQ9_9PSEU
MGINAKVIKRGVLAIAAVAAVGALGACSTGQPGNAAAAPQGSGGVGGGVGIGAAPNGGTYQNADVNRPAEPRQAGEAGGRGVTTGSETNCANLKVTWQNPSPVNDGGTQWKLPLKLTNQTSVSCVVRGFPGVRLTGEDGTSWDLVRTNDPITPVRLGAGEDAFADLTYSTAVGLGDGSGKGAGDGSGWHVATMSVTPPNGTNTQTMPWVDSLDLVKQDGATHPGTYIGAVRAGK